MNVTASKWKGKTKRVKSVQHQLKVVI